MAASTDLSDLLLDTCACVARADAAAAAGAGSADLKGAHPDRARAGAGATSLVVLVHGLHGSPHRQLYLSRAIRRCLPCASRGASTAAADGSGGDDAGATDVTASATGQRCPGVVILRAAANHGVLSSFVTTADGVDRGGRRLAKEAKRVLDARMGIREYSVVGHSLGGLYARYLAKELASLIAADAKHRVERYTDTARRPVPAVYCSLGTPHLGVRGRLPTSIHEYGVSLGVVGRTGYQLLLSDGNRDLPVTDAASSGSGAGAGPGQRTGGGAAADDTGASLAAKSKSATAAQRRFSRRPLLMRMAAPDGPYVAALRTFRSRLLVAALEHDEQVNYHTAALVGDSEDRAARVSGFVPLLEFPSIKNVFSAAPLGATVDGNRGVESTEADGEAAAAAGRASDRGGRGGGTVTRPKAFAPYDPASPEARMLAGLRTLQWTNVDVRFSERKWLTHDNLTQSHPLTGSVLRRSGEDAVVFAARLIVHGLTGQGTLVGGDGSDRSMLLGQGDAVTSKL